MVSLSDDFNRADNAASMGSTSGGGVAWSALRGTWGIASNQGYTATPNGSATDIAVVETGVADGTVTVTLPTAPTTPSECGLTFRAVDISNWFVVQSAGTALKVYRNVAGTVTEIGSAASQRPASGDTLSVVMSGTSIVVKRNGSTVISLTDSAHTAATKHGLNNYQTGTRFDSFDFTDPAAGVPVAAAVTDWVTPAISLPIHTDNSNGMGGWQLGGYATARVTTPVAANHFPGDAGIEVEAAKYLPPPTIENGEIK